jgi:hypothetical protein
MNTAYQSLPFLRKTLKSSWWQNRKNGIHSNQQHYSTCWDKFPDAKKSVMKYCSSTAIGGSLHTLHVTETKWKWDKEILYIIYKFTQIYL